ncbi:hypothetical protein HYX08_03130 [Candidatus Woesearchaeota archaeon]|nr:hypothetical protein [Candidatus Woesearchaeota archaeon]
MDLTEKLGFKAELNPDTGEITFIGLSPVQPLERHLADLRPVLAEPDEINGHGSQLVHRIYRFIGDTPEIVDTALRFDLTVVMPYPFGRELPKTTGHRHLPLPWASGVSSPDFYQRISGKGIILGQKETVDGRVTAYQIDAEEMNHVLLPPWMGHLVINTGEEPLVFANICVRIEHTDYAPYLNRRGAAFYGLKNGSTGPEFVKNPAYPNAGLENLRPDKIPTLDRFNGAPLYRVLADHHDLLRFLVRPHHFLDWFQRSLKKP